MNTNMDSTGFLRQLRLNNDEPLMDMANKLGVSVIDITAIETGVMQSPIGFWDKVCNVYNVKSSDVLNYILTKCLNKDRQQTRKKVDIMKKVKKHLRRK